MRQEDIVQGMRIRLVQPTGHDSLFAGKEGDTGIICRDDGSDLPRILMDSGYGWYENVENMEPEYDIATADHDVVNSPSHYKEEGKIECIDYIRERMTDEQYKGYLLGNVYKYIHRWQHKNGKEDLDKADWYLERLQGEEE